MTVTRRTFIHWSSLTGAALVLGISQDERVFALTPTAAAFEPNKWLRIDADGRITIVAHKSEMGQGVRTALPMIVAEELGADWSRVTVAHAQPGASFPDMRTSGSGSVSGSWHPLRVAAAAAREMLIGAAAARWSVQPSTCATERGAVVHRPTSRHLEFGALVEAAARLPVPAEPTLKPSSEYRLLGQRVPRVDGREIVTGTATYGLDVKVRGMRYAAIARPPTHNGRIASFDATRARAVPGVVDVVETPVGIAVVATNTWAALQGRDALVIHSAPGVGATGDTAAFMRTLDDAMARGGKPAVRRGDVAAALAASGRRMTATYRAPFQGHAALEPLNCIAHVHDGRCEIWVGTQAPNEAQQDVAKLLGIPRERVTMHVTLLGGGFGRRLDYDYVIEAVELARKIDGPVQVVWSREDDTRHDRYQPGQVNRLTTSLDARGLPVAWRHEVADFNLTMFGDYDPNYDPAADGDPWGAFDTPYGFDLDVTLALAPSPVPSGAWRSVTYPAAVMARESFLDEIAVATRRDPVELRLALLASPGTVSLGSVSVNNGDRLRAVLRLAAEKSGWGTPLRAPNDGRRWGRGVAINAYHRQTMVAQVAEVSVGPQGDWRVHRVVCAVDCGQVINRSGLEAQFEGGVMWALSALRNEITFANGATVQGNYNDYPVVRMREAPKVEVHVVPSTLRPFGIGEQPVPAVGPAVANAICAATGQRLRQTPLRLSAVR
ncbi:MAG TPA: molybdopterin cofactor-binding domain-containing protein [Gemmatimonadaceae bacterium]|nr:molybdopterin cofactor-binding domain-containing protein [Gemmatimonadaceae bacterium]